MTTLSRRFSAFSGYLIVLLLSAYPLSVAAQSRPIRLEITKTEIDPVVHALCHKEVALLGEAPIHGLGNTLQFKAELVHRLIDECHYEALFMESGLYDYIHIERELRAGQGVTEPTISAAIGGIWATEEVQTLVPFLRRRMLAGRLTLGGLDDQLGAGTYASRQMAPDLVQTLTGDIRSRCLGILQKRLLWQYTSDAPYSPTDKQEVIGCLNTSEKSLETAGNTIANSESKAMVASLERSVERDFAADDHTKQDQRIAAFNARDWSMYLNYKWLVAQQSPHRKVIIWASTVHTAKRLSDVEGLQGMIPFGSYIQENSSGKTFSLGFSAYSGEYAFTHQPVRRLSDAPVSSLEAQLFARGDSDAVFLSREQLRTYGAVPARPLGADFKTANWDQVVDGLVVFRAEHAPAWILSPGS